MNERIQELAEQAGLKVNYWKTNPPTPMQILADYEQVEKFAELIVRECAGICEEHHAWTARMVGNQIKDHFGVE